MSPIYLGYLPLKWTYYYYNHLPLYREKPVGMKSYKSIRVDADVYEAVRSLAEIESRPISTQLRLLVETAFESVGRQDILTAARAHRPMPGEDSFPELEHTP